jgi:hypothetical protein
MSKKTSEGASRNTRPTHGERTPALLSEKLVAKLQEAVEAAQRKRDRALSPNDVIRDEGKPAHGLDNDQHRST